MDIKGLIRKDLQRTYSNYQYYNQRLNDLYDKDLQRRAEIEEQEEEKKKQIAEQEEQEKQEYLAEKSRQQASQKTQSDKNEEFNLLNSIKNSPRFFSTFDENGKLRTYYQTPNEVEERRQKIQSIPEAKRTAEDQAYYSQLDPGYIDRIKHLYDAAKTYREANDYKQSFKYWSILKSAIKEGLSNPNIGANPGLMPAPMKADEYSMEGLTHKTVQQFNDNRYLDDAFASYIQKKNIVEVETDAGNIALNDERRQYMSRITKYNSLIQEYLDLYDKYKNAQFLHAAGRDQNVSPLDSVDGIKQRMEQKILEAKALEDGVKEAYSYNLGSNYGTSISGLASKNLYNFTNGIKDGLPVNQNILLYLKQGVEQLKPLMQQSLQTMQEDDKSFMRRADRNMAELRKWQAWHTPSAEFLAREQAAQDNRLSNLDTYIASMPGVMGSSASFNGVQIAGMAFNYFGQYVMMSGNPYVSTAGAVSVGLGAGFNFAAGVYENAAEVATNYKTGLIERLQKEGLYEKFLKDGKKQLKENNIDVKNDDEVATYFMLKRWVPYNRRIREIAEQQLYGANNLFQNDMIATTADVVFDTSLSMFAPYGPLAKGSKFAPIPKSEALKRLYRMQGKTTQYDIVNNLTKESGVGTFISSGMSPVAGGLYRAARTAVTPITSHVSRALSPYVKQFAKKLDDIVGFSKVIPNKIVMADHIGGKLVDFAGRTLAKGFSEAVEEGKQHEFGERFARGEFAGAHHNILQAFMDDLSVGVSTGFEFLGHQLLGLEADQKLMAEMRGGFLGGLLNIPTVIETVRTGIGVVEDKKAIDIVYQNLLAEKYKGRSAILNAENFAKYITPKGYRRMMEVFDAYKEAMGHVSESGRDGFSEEDIENQRKEFQRIYRVATSKYMHDIAALRGIKPNSDKYRTFVALAHYIDQEKKDKIDETNSIRTAWNTALQENSITSEQFDNLEQLVASGLQDPSLTDKQRDYLQQLIDDLQSQNPSLTGKALANVMKTSVNLERQTNVLMAQYYALKKLVQEMDAMREASPEEYQNHRRKANVYRQELESFLEKFNDKGIFDEYESRTLDISQIRDEEVMNPSLFDELNQLYRRLVIGNTQIEDLEYDWMNLLGEDVHSEDVFENMQSLSDPDLYNVLQRAHDNYKRQRERLTKVERIARSRKATEDLINKFKDSVDNDEKFIEEINRDFIETLKLNGQRSERRTVQQQEEPVEFNPFVQSEDRSKVITENFLNTVEDAQKKDYRQDLLGSESTDGQSRAQQAIDLYSDGAYVEENKSDVLPVFSNTGGTHRIVNIPIDKRFTHVATRPDGSRVYITKSQADLIEYLNSLNDQAEESVTKRFFKSKYVSPVITSSYYEDSILDAIISNDKDRFNRLIENIDGYVSEEKINFFKQLWEEGQKQIPQEGIVPINGTKRILSPDSEIRKKVRQAVDSCLSVITLLGNYQNAIPSDQDLSDHLNLFLGTLEEKDRKQAKKDLDKSQNETSKQKQAEFYVNAGFQFSTRKTAKSVVYEAISPTGETYKITKKQYEYASWLKYYKDRTNSTTLGEEVYPDDANDKQKSVLKLLRQKLAYENPQIIRNDLRTAMDYFIVERGKIVRYSRVHSQIQSQFLKSPSWQQDKNDIIAKLRNVFQNKDEYKLAVTQYQDRFNNLLIQKYGENSETYKRYKIDLYPYLLDDVISDAGSIESIAEICALGKQNGEYKLDIANRAVLGGSIVDEICRDFFAGRRVHNYEQYKMPQEVFDKLIQDLQKQKELYEKRGWVLSTEPYCWHATMPNGTRVAGETDMVAVDKDGNIYIIDFKTSKYSFLQKQYKVISPVVGEKWENVIDDEDIPEGAETRVIPFALDQGEEQVKNKYKRWNERQITARQNYEEQQTFYANLIRFDLQNKVNVAGVELLTFQVKIKAGVNPITGEYDQAIFDGFARSNEDTNTRDDKNELVTGDAIQFQGSVKLNFSENINALWYEDMQLTQQKRVLSTATQRYNDLYLRTVSFIQQNENKISAKTKKEFNSLQETISQLAKDSVDFTVLSDKTAVENLIDKINQEYSKLQQINGQALQDVVNYDIQNPQQVHGTSRRKLNTNRKEAWGQVQRFNCLNLFDEKWVGEELSRVSANPDFLNSAVFEIDVDSYEKTRVVQGRRIATPTVFVTIYYDEHLDDKTVKHHKFERIKLLFAKEDNNGVQYTFGLDGNNTSPLLAKIEAAISNPENKGKRIFLTNGSRTNGIVKYGTQQQTLQQAFNLSEEDMEQSVAGTQQGSVLGINKNGSVYLTKSDVGSLSVLYGIDPDRALTDGLMSWYLNLNYDEDNGSKQHVIPIALTPKPLTESDANFIIDLLKNFTKRRKIKINGKEYDSPISNSRLLRTIVRFGKGAEKTGNDFIFEWANVDDKGVPTDYNTIRIAIKGKFDRSINLLDEGQVKILKDILQNELYVYYNNEYAMHHASSSSRDASNNNNNAPYTNPFVGLEKFFKEHPELTEDGKDVVIEYSESMKFRRSDVDPELNGTYKGINGAHWMMRNGWMQTNFSGIRLPLFAFEDIEVSQENKVEPEIDISVETNTEELENAQIPDEEVNWSDVGDNYEDGAALEWKVQQVEQAKPLDRSRAEKRLRHILGNSFSIQFKDKAIDILKGGWAIVAACKTDAIVLTDLAGNDEEFHEAFHAVVDLLIGEKQRKALYEHYKQHYSDGKTLTDTEVSEGLADMYYEFRQNTPIEWSWNIIKVFTQISNWVKQLYNLHDAKLAMLFVQTNMGYFRNRTPDPESIAAFKARNKSREYQPYMVRTDDGQYVDFKNFTSFRQFDDAVKGLVYRIIRDFGIDNLMTNIENLKIDKQSLISENSPFRKTYARLTAAGKTLEQIDEAVKNGDITVLQKENVLRYRELFDKYSVTQKFIIRELDVLGINSIQKRQKENKNDAEGGSVVQDMVELGNGEFYTHARSESIETQVKYFLSTVPSVRWLTDEDISNGLLDKDGNPYTSIYRKNKNGEIIYDTNGKPVRLTVAMSRNTLGEINFQDFQQVYQKLLKHLYNVKDVQDLINKLNNLADSDYVFYHVLKSLIVFRNRSYIRYNDVKYGNIPKVMYKGKLLNPSEYIRNLQNPTQDELYPKTVRYSHDIINDETGEVEHKAGDIIKGAIILTNPDYESITTQIFQAIKSQKLNFTFCYEQPIIDESGEIVAGKHKYNIGSTSVQADTRVYPILWFNYLRSSTTGIFDMNENGEFVINNQSDNIKVFEQSRKFLLRLQASFAPNLRNRAKLDDTNKLYDIDNDEDFDKILTMFTSALNNVGIGINKQAIIYGLTSKYPNLKLQTAFEYIFSSNLENSIRPFIQDGGILDTLQKAIDSGNIELFTRDLDTKESKTTKAARSGSYLYSMNGFVISMAYMFSDYKASSQEMMVLGPENTKMYTFAQNHSASDTTYELNNVYDDDGNITPGNIMEDLQNVSYITIQQGERRLGSVIAKYVLDKTFNPNHNRITLHTSSGLKTQSSKEGGVKYANVTEREDYLNKVAILKNNIVFPTLSDKSTWFYLSGIKLPGLNWDATDIDEFGAIPTVGLKSGRLFLSNQDKIGSYQQNPVLDQMIEYALCELANIEKTIDDLGLNESQEEASSAPLTDEKKVVNYHTKGKPDKNGNYKDAGLHGARFFFLTGVYDERDGKYIEFNKVNKSDDDLGVIKCYKLAKEYFFDKRINPQTGVLETDEELRARQRSQIMAILQRRTDEALQYLVQKGIITVNQNLRKYSNKQGQKQVDAIPQYFGYQNKYLDASDIRHLAEIYHTMYKGKYDMMQCESLAIVAYIFDINNKSIMSMEETERIYTGMPQFFKCKYDSAGHLIDRGEDESKRYGGEGSTGSNNREDLPNIESEYTCAEIKDWEIPSAISNTLSDAFRLDEYRDALATRRVDQLKSTGEYTIDEERAIYRQVYAMKLEQLKTQFTESDVSIIEAKIKAEAKSFQGGINVADGTAYISDKMAENLLRQRGKYNGKVKEAFEYLRNHKKATVKNAETKENIPIEKRNGYLTSYKAYRIIHNAMISTQKYTAFGFRMENNVPVHFFNKYALFPIFEGMSYGFTRVLYEKMNDEQNPVDMVMFESAVKSGSEGAQTFNPEMTEDEIDNFSFKNHIYKQKYKFLRRQLNTDPRTSEIMSMGTQAGKIALSTLKDGQEYTLRDGTKILGVELKDKIMDAQRVLSDRGVDKITKQFFKEGVENIEAFSEFAKDELMSRDADKNILDAIQVEDDPDNRGEKRFHLDLNAVSNMAWLESILCSHINESVIDINLPGNAYYQRSVFGMEGPVIMSDEDLQNDIQGYVINNEKPLQMINEKGSMDALISIDYFLHLIPKDIRYDFVKARQFLIDNKIIGPDAEANTMAYRIPTQAVSSVHALRFIDVIPVVRDTIVLPKEFTKITGSDFDIDKLYLSSFNYKLEEGKITRDYDKNSDEYLQNQLLSYYFALLEDAGKQVNDGIISESRYMHMLHRSIDNDTSLVDHVLETLQKNAIKHPYEPMQFGCLHTQVYIKSTFISGKKGIAPFALNNNSHIFTMLYNVSFAKSENGLLDALNMRSLAKALDRDGNSILSWLSAMINIHVDAAKDPKSLKLNINEATYNLTNLLLRLGLGQDALYFLTQPIVRDLADVYQDANGSIVEDPGLSPTKRYELAEARYINQVHVNSQKASNILKALVYRNLPKDERDDTVTQADVENYRNEGNKIIRAIFAINEDGTYDRKFETENGVVVGKSILEDIMTNSDVLVDPEKPISLDNLKDTAMYKIGDSYYSPKEIQVFVFMAKQQFDQYAQALSELVQYTKIDTKKHGKNYSEQREYKKNYDRMHDAFETARKNGTVPLSMFDENLERMLDDSFINRKTNNAIRLLPNIMGKHMIHMTDSFDDVVNYICTILNNKTKATRSVVQRKLLAYIKQKCINQYMNENDIDFRSMISGNNTLSSRIEALKRKILSDTTGKYSDFVTNGIITNTLLANIHPVPYVAQYGEELYDIITLDNIQSNDESKTNDYIDSWQQLLDSDDEEINQIGNDLAVYAFMTSGDETGFTKFFKYVPDSWRISSGYDANMRKMKRAFLDGAITVDGNYNSLFNIDSDEFIRNNWTNHNIIPVMQAYTVRPKTRDEIELTGSAGNIYEQNYIGHKFNYKDLNAGNMEVDKQADQIIAGVVVRNGRVKVTISMNPDTASFPPYIKMRRKNSSMYAIDPYILYKLVAVGVKEDNNGALHEYPVYALTYPKGYSVNALSQRFDFYEYERDDQYTHIFDPSVMIGDQYGDKLRTICSQIQEYVDSFGNIPTSLSSVIDPNELLEQESDSQMARVNTEYEQVLLDIYKAEQYRESQQQFDTGTQYPGMPEFNKLPAYTGNTMTYAGIGSRNIDNVVDADTKRPIKEVMKEVAAELEQLGYTLNSGHADGSDTAFEEGVSEKSNKQIFTRSSATSRMYKIAREIHPNWNALGAYSKGLHARNTAQVFGRKLDTPVDFVLCYTPDGAETDARTGATDHLTGYNRPGIPNTGGTGQAISMASMKGIPVINMANPGWRQRLNDIISKSKSQSKKSGKISQTENTASHGVIISDNILKEYDEFLQKHPEGIVAYRVNKSNFNTRQAVDKGIIGNPFDWQKYGTGDAVEMFYKWLTTGWNYGEPLATEDFRMAIIEKLIDTQESKDSPILYYKELNRWSHATVIGYLREAVWERVAFLTEEDANSYIHDLGIQDNFTVKKVNPKNEDIDSYYIIEPTNNPKQQTVDKNTMRIWAGKNPENADLSNMYPRKFVLNYSSLHFANNLKEYHSNTVETAFQYAKFMYASLIYENSDHTWNNSQRVSELLQHAYDITKAQNPWEAKKLGKQLQLTEQELAYWNKIKYRVMKWIISESFRQNPQAMQRLLSTGDVVFTHEDDNSEWKELFPKALMEVRDEFRKLQHPQFTQQQLQEGQQNKQKCKGE